MIEMEIREAEFLARVTDMVAHELRNVLATAKEYTEHMEDVLAAANSNGIREKQLLQEGLAAIRGQISRGSNLAQRMNLFSHGQDSPESELDLNELVEMLEPLSKPFSRTKGLKMNLNHPVQPMVMVGHPLRILMILSGCMDFLASLTEPRDTMEIRVSRRQGRGVMVSFTSPHISKGIRRETWAPIEHRQWNELESLAAGIHARIGLIGEPGMLLVVFETEWI